VEAGAGSYGKGETHTRPMWSAGNAGPRLSGAAGRRRSNVVFDRSKRSRTADPRRL